MARHTDALIALGVAGLVGLLAAPSMTTAAGTLLAAPSVTTAVGTLRSTTVLPLAVTAVADSAATPDVGARYLALASPLNARLAELSGELDTPRTLEEMRSISNRYADVEEEFAAGLGSLAVPASFGDLVVDAEMAARHVAALNRRLADPDTAGNQVTAIGSDLSHALDDQRRSIERLREALGLGLGLPPSE